MIRRKIEEMGYGVFIGLVAVIIVLALIYQFLIGDLFLALIAMSIAVIGCYYLFRYITEEEQPLKLREGEKPILKALDLGVVLFPRKKDKFFGKEGYRDVSIYLTSERMLARRHNEFVMDIPLDSVLNWREEERMKSNYVRVTFLDKGRERDVILFVGNTTLWMDKLGGLIKPEVNTFSVDTERVKELV